MSVACSPTTLLAGCVISFLLGIAVANGWIG